MCSNCVYSSGVQVMFNLDSTPPYCRIGRIDRRRCLKANPLWPEPCILGNPITDGDHSIVIGLHVVVTNLTWFLTWFLPTMIQKTQLDWLQKKMTPQLLNRPSFAFPVCYFVQKDAPHLHQRPWWVSKSSALVIAHYKPPHLGRTAHLFSLSIVDWWLSGNTNNKICKKKKKFRIVFVTVLIHSSCPLAFCFISLSFHGTLSPGRIEKTIL